MPSRHDAAFDRHALPVHAEQFGEGPESVTLTQLDGQEVRLSHVVLGDERRTWEKNGFGYHLLMVRSGWLISNPERHNFSGIQQLQQGASLTVDGSIYTIDQITSGQHVIDFRLVRAGEVEKSSPNFRREPV
jgi:hypothetical protein